MRPFSKLIMVLSAMCLLFAGTWMVIPAVAADQAPADDKVALVNGTAISRAQFNQGVSRMSKPQPGQEQPEAKDQLKQVQAQALDALIRNLLLYQASQKAGVKIEDKAIDEQIGALKQRFPSEEEFNQALAQVPATVETLRQQIREQMAIRQYIDKEFADKAIVSETEAKAYYDEHPEYFKAPAQVKASHILAKVEEQNNADQKAAALDKIKKAQKRLEGGDDFATVAKEMSDCPSSSKGGELGYFSRGQMAKPFEDAAFAMKPGETSGIVETQFGYHLIRVEEQKPEGKVELAQAQPKIEQYLKRQKLMELVNKQVSELEKTAKIEKFLD